MHNNQSEYKDLYKTILEIGKSRINEGISYKELKSKLVCKGFKMDDCSELAVKKFMIDNYLHLPSEDKDEPTPKNIGEQHPDCGFVMTGEACLKLERLIELEQLKSSNTLNFRLAIAAIVIGLIGNLPNWFPSLQFSSKKFEQSEQSSIKLNEEPEVTLRLTFDQFQDMIQQQTLGQNKMGDSEHPNNTSSNQFKTGRNVDMDGRVYGQYKNHKISTKGNYPKSVLEIPNPSGKGNLHPTIKPVDLMKWFIEQYSLVGDMVLDNTMGVGTTCLGAKELNRSFIGIEKEVKYYDLAVARVFGQHCH